MENSSEDKASAQESNGEAEKKDTETVGSLARSSPAVAGIEERHSR
jgi:hypothetical protein